MTRLLPRLPFAMLLVILPFPGTVAARLLLLVVCFGIALRYWWRMPESRAPIPCKPVLSAWILVAVASLAYAVDPLYSLGEIKNELGYTMMAFFAFYTVAGKREDAAWLLGAALAGLVLIGGLAVGGWVAHGRVWREDAIHGGIGVFGTYLVTVLPVLAWFALEAGSLRARWTVAALCALFLFLAVIVAQRAVWPVIAVQALLVLVLAARDGRVGGGRYRLVGSVTAIVLLAGAGMLYSQYARFGADQGLMSDDVRLAFWPTVMASIAENPLTGVGFGRSVMHKAYPGLIPADAPALWHAHNIFLNYGLQLGIAGVLALAGVFFAFAMLFWRAATKSRAAAGIAGLMLVAGVVLRNQFNDFFLRDMSLLFWGLTGIFARLSVATAGQEQKCGRHKSEPHINAFR